MNADVIVLVSTSIVRSRVIKMNLIVSSAKLNSPMKEPRMQLGRKALKFPAFSEDITDNLQSLKIPLEYVIASKICNLWSQELISSIFVGEAASNR